MLLFHKLNNLLYNGKYYSNYFSSCIRRYNEIGAYLSLYNCFNKKSINKTVKEIAFDSNIIFGSTLSDFKKKINIPYRLVKNKEYTDIIFYTTKIGETFQTNVELHFFKNRLVFFKKKFTPNVDENIIYNSIKEKYLTKNEYFSIKDNIIADESGAFINIEKEVYLSINYLTFKYGFYDFLCKKQRQTEIYEIKEKEGVLNELLNNI